MTREELITLAKEIIACSEGADAAVADAFLEADAERERLQALADSHIAQTWEAFRQRDSLLAERDAARAEVGRLRSGDTFLQYNEDVPHHVLHDVLTPNELAEAYSKAQAEVERLRLWINTGIECGFSCHSHSSNAATAFLTAMKQPGDAASP